MRFLNRHCGEESTEGDLVHARASVENTAAAVVAGDGDDRVLSRVDSHVDVVGAVAAAGVDVETGAEEKHVPGVDGSWTHVHLAHLVRNPLLNWLHFPTVVSHFLDMDDREGRVNGAVSMAPPAFPMLTTDEATGNHIQKTWLPQRWNHVPLDHSSHEHFVLTMTRGWYRGNAGKDVVAYGILKPSQHHVVAVDPDDGSTVGVAYAAVASRVADNHVHVEDGLD